MSNAVKICIEYAGILQALAAAWFFACCAGDVFRTGKRKSRPVLTLLPLTVMELLLLLQHCLTADGGVRLWVLLSFGLVMACQWAGLMFSRSLGHSSYAAESAAFFLTALGFSVACSSVPGGLWKQCLLFLGAFGGYLAVSLFVKDRDRAERLCPAMAFLALGLLGLNLVFSERIWGARNWLTVFGHSFQPSEFVKLAYVWHAAALPRPKQTRKSLILFSLFSALCVGILALNGDFGTAAVFFCCYLFLVWFRYGSLLTIGAALTAAAAAVLAVLKFRPYVARRFAVWGHVWEDPLDAGFQQVRTLSAAASGGLFGRGAGTGWLKGVPAADTDLVFGMLCEELGLLTAVLALLTVCLLAVYALRAMACGRVSFFYTLTAASAAVLFLAQAGLNTFGSLDILPLTGVTFPFVSRGGSSLISCWCLLAFSAAAEPRKRSSAGSRKTPAAEKRKAAAPAPVQAPGTVKEPGGQMVLEEFTGKPVKKPGRITGGKPAPGTEAKTAAPAAAKPGKTAARTAKKPAAEAVNKNGTPKRKTTAERGTKK